MRRENVNDLLAFIAVAREQSFTKAAAKLQVSQSALSYTIRTLEERLGLRLLTRTTRSVSLTEAGDRLLRSIGPRFDEIETEISALSGLRDKPAGTVRITTVEHAAETILWPAMAKLLPEYPDVNVEIITDYGLTDIVAERYDAGVRLGEQVDKDMIAVRSDLTCAWRWWQRLRTSTGGGSRGHRRNSPTTPASICVCPPMEASTPGNSGRAAASLKSASRDGPCSTPLALIQDAALEGLGLAYLPEDRVEAAYQKGSARACSRGLVSASSGLSPLLPEPPPTLAGIRARRGCASFS